MPQNEGSQHDGASHERFEEELGAVLRSTGDGFAVDDRRELVAGGLRRGRRRLVRRRLAVTGGVVALAAVGIGGAYGGSLLGPAGQATTTSVAAPPQPGQANGTGTGARTGKKPFAQPQIPVKDIAAVLKAHTPAGQWRFDDLDGKGQSATGVYDDGRGEAGVSVGLYRAGETAESGIDQVMCPDRALVPFDSCTSERLPGGDRLMVFQGYEYPDKREETKNWRAVLLTKDGIVIDASEYNAAAEKGAAISRETPPFSPAQLKALVTADAWGPLLRQLPELPKSPEGPGRAPSVPSAAAVQATLRSLLPGGVTVESHGGGDGHGYVVVDDGKGASLVGVDVQPLPGDGIEGLFTGAGVVTLPGGTKVRSTQQAGEKGGAGVVWWSVDTLSPKGFRVSVSAFNSGAQHEAATRAEPALTMEQLKAIALSPKWRKLPLK
ncbi:hypothetical protein [Streptomyces sp. TLI_105]|uniref:hypothetical protein n=1 Tax=Streptomyces sp. TLI_105 TaxID=1881019 RepID=UPI00089A1F34|nr:hypothetical protein [Streptomyces sp. TLI_105]SED09757.1 hypothetical protein SAMN05428939_4196 [Streptomyces sp. TLI_105]